MSLGYVVCVGLDLALFSLALDCLSLSSLFVLVCLF